MSRHDDADQGPQLVHIATLGSTALPDRLDGVALILRMPSGNGAGAGADHAALSDWIRLCRNEDCAIITASVTDGNEDLPPNGVDGFVSFDMQGDMAMREDFPEMQIIAANVSSRHLAMQAGDLGADALFFGDLRAGTLDGMQAATDHDLAEWWVEIMQVPCIIPVASAAEDPDYAPEFIAVPLP